ncbi:MAG TPA: MMPL family transporter [Candidatus Binatia bacterium]
METYARFLVRRAWLVLGAVALVTVWIALGLRELRTDFDVESSLPKGHPFVEIDKTIREQFGGRHTVIALMVPRDGGDVWRTEILETVRDATLLALRMDDVIAQNVVSLASPNVRAIEDVGGTLNVDLVMRDPPQTPEEIAALRAKVEADPQLEGMVVTPDQRAAVLVFDFWEDAERNEMAQRALAIAEELRDRPVDFYFAGEPMLSLTDVEQSKEVGRRIPITFAVIAVMLLISFRNVQGMLIPMLTAALSTVWGLGLMGHTGIVIDSWNVATPILLIAIAAGHSAQMLKRYSEEVARLGDNREAVVASTVAMGPVMIAAGGVAALGFASLVLTGIPAIVGFGLSCAYGIASAVILEMTFIPALRTVLPAPRVRTSSTGPTARLLAMLESAILANRGRSVLIATAIALVVAIIGALQIRTYGPTSEYMARGSLPRHHLEEIKRHFPGTVTMNVLYEGPPDSVKNIAVLKHMDALRAELEKDPLVWRTASLVDLVKMLHKTFNPEAPVPYSLPDDQELVSQLIFLGDSPAFERFIDRGYTKSLLIAYLRDDDSALVGPLVRRAQEWLAANPPPEGERVLIAGGVGPTVLAVNEHTTHSKVINMLIVLLTIYAVSSVVLRSPLSGVYVVTPIVLSLVLLFGMLGWTGIRLDMGSSTILAMAAGIGADYAIYFLYRLREEHSRVDDDAAALHAAMQTSGRAVVFVASSIAAGFAVMGLGSDFFGLRLFGTLMPTAMVISCIASLAVMPVLVLRTRPAFVFGPRFTRAEATTAAATGA